MYVRLPTAQATLLKSRRGAAEARSSSWEMGVIPNLGQKRLNLSDSTADMQSVFQVAAVTRPLMSVGKICDEGHTVTFSDVMAVVHNKEGEELCKFHRSNGGLYVAKLKLRSPAGFGRPE
jgi:hypothetical protein